MPTLPDKIVELARKYLGVTETKRNSGPLIDEWLHNVGCHPGDPWCAAYAWSVVDEASRTLGLPNPLRKTGSVHWLWQTAPSWLRVGIPAQGAIFCIDHGAGKGHCGIVVSHIPGAEPMMRTIEGNTNAEGSREGTMVRERERFCLEVNMGYLDFSKPQPNVAR